jgi:hypothetical protein
MRHHYQNVLPTLVIPVQVAGIWEGQDGGVREPLNVCVPFVSTSPAISYLHFCHFPCIFTADNNLS